MTTLETLKFMRDNPPPMAARTLRGYVAGLDAAIALLRESSPSGSTGYALRLIRYSDGAKIPVIKAIREITRLGLKETKDLAESCPSLVPGWYHTHAEAGAKARELRIAGADVHIIGGCTL